MCAPTKVIFQACTFTQGANIPFYQLIETHDSFLQQMGLSTAAGLNPSLFSLLQNCSDVAWTSGCRCKRCKILRAVPRQRAGTALAVPMQSDRHSLPPRDARRIDVQYILLLTGTEAFPLADKPHLYN